MWLFAFLTHCRRWMWLSIAILTVAAGAETYEPWAPMFETPLKSRVTPEEVRLIRDFLQFSNEQAHALDGLYQQHRGRFDEFEAEHAPLRERLDEVVAQARREEPAKWLELAIDRERRLAKVADEQAALDEQFMTDVRDFLSTSQQERWDLLVERIRRARWAGAAPGEGQVDLIRIAEDITGQDFLPRGDGALQEVLRSYSSDLDRALAARVQETIESSRHHRRSRADQMRIDGDRIWMVSPDDLNAFWRERKKKRDLIQAVGDVNSEYRDLVKSLLPDSDALEFDRLYFQQALGPWFVDELPFRPYLEKVREQAPDLNEDQRAAIQVLSLQYESKAKRLNEAILRAGEARIDVNHEPVEHPSQRQQAKQNLERAREQRRNLDADAVAELSALLTPEQHEKVDPAPKAEPAPQS